MPSEKTRFVVFDTSIYVENFRTGRFTDQMLHSGMIPRCSAVVLHELLRGAHARDEVAFVRALRKNCRLVIPTEEHWHAAAEVLRAMRHRQRYARSSLAALTLDVLIALAARSIGATLVTSNRADFAAIRRQLTFAVAYW